MVSALRKLTGDETLKLPTQADLGQMRERGSGGPEQYAHGR
jgi:hypothetical protein